jgi:hypothetical protein
MRDEQSGCRDGIETPVHELRFIPSCASLEASPPLTPEGQRRPSLSQRPSVHPCWLGNELDPLPSFLPHLGEIVVKIALEIVPTPDVSSAAGDSLAEGYSEQIQVF